MPLFTIGLKDAAASLGLSVWTLRRYIREGRLASVRIGRRVLVEPAELRRLVEAGRTGGRKHGEHLLD